MSIQVEKEKRSEHSIGLINGFIAYIIWGAVILYWPYLAPAQPLEILAHRILWSLLFVAAILIYQKRIVSLKVVMKNTPVFASGSPYTFATAGKQIVDLGTDIPSALAYLPRHQVYMEGAGVLIPPQVQWYVDYRIFNVVTGATIAAEENTAIGCYLFGTRVLLNFNTSI